MTYYYYKTYDYMHNIMIKITKQMRAASAKKQDMRCGFQFRAKWRKRKKRKK